MSTAEADRAATADEIVSRLRRHSTAAVLFHHAVAERLGLGPTDHKCLDLLRDRGAMIGSELAAITGLTSGAVTGVVARLERAGFVRRERDPRDQRKQILRATRERARDLEEVFGPIRADAAPLLEGFDARQLAAIAEFLERSTAFIYRRAALLRAQTALSPHEHDAAATASDPGSAHG
jgi:DNA-binding MarR family transcriptional regulator